LPRTFRILRPKRGCRGARQDSAQGLRVQKTASGAAPRRPGGGRGSGAAPRRPDGGRGSGAAPRLPGGGRGSGALSL